MIGKRLGYLLAALVALAVLSPAGKPGRPRTAGMGLHRTSCGRQATARQRQGFSGVPDSTAGYTLKQISDPFLAPDWHPADHPKMPEIVAHGRKPSRPGLRVLPSRRWSRRPENASCGTSV